LERAAIYPKSGRAGDGLRRAGLKDNGGVAQLEQRNHNLILFVAPCSAAHHRYRSFLCKISGLRDKVAPDALALIRAN
jgi:hypothetical protein